MEKKNDFKPFISADKVLPEFTVTSVILGMILAVIFGGANAYLGLRVGMTVSASIPAAVIEGTEKVDYTVYIWYNVSIKYRRCFYDRTTAEIDAKSIHGNI